MPWALSSGAKPLLPNIRRTVAMAASWLGVGAGAVPASSPLWRWGRPADTAPLRPAFTATLPGRSLVATRCWASTSASSR